MIDVVSCSIIYCTTFYHLHVFFALYLTMLDIEINIQLSFSSCVFHLSFIFCFSISFFFEKTQLYWDVPYFAICTKYVPYLWVYNAHPHFWPKLSGKIIFCFNFFFTLWWFIFFNFNFVLLFNYSFVPFLPIPPPQPSWTPSLPNLHPPPWFCPCVLYSSSYNPLSSLSPPHSPLPIVRLFLTSMSLVIFCFLFSSTYYVPVKGEIIWYLSLTTWLISLSIMLCSSIHAVAKGISSFFLSAA